MSKKYIILYSKDDLTREALVENLAKNGISEYWEFCIPNSVFIKSSKTTKEISEFLDKEYGSFRHLVIDYSVIYGRLPEEYWNMFK
jgi:hypothetical protein